MTVIRSPKSRILWCNIRSESNIERSCTFRSPTEMSKNIELRRRLSESFGTVTHDLSIFRLLLLSYAAPVHYDGMIVIKARTQCRNRKLEVTTPSRVIFSKSSGENRVGRRVGARARAR